MTRTTCVMRRISKHEAITLTDANGREIAQIRIADSCPTASTTISMRLPEDIKINKPVKRSRRQSRVNRTWLRGL
jgi:hypothetical protein